MIVFLFISTLSFILSAVTTFTGINFTIRVLSFICCIVLTIIVTFIVTTYIAATTDDDYWED